MKYKIIQSMKTGEFTGQYGRTIKYGMVLSDEADNTIEGVELSQKPETPLPVGEIEGTIEDTQWGKRFKKTPTGGGFSKFNDPQTRNEIIRQNSLTNAVAFCTAKANLMEKKVAIEYLTGKKIIQVATYFAKYSKGEVTVVTENEIKEDVDKIDQEKEKDESVDQGDLSEESINQVMNEDN